MAPARRIAALGVLLVVLALAGCTGVFGPDGDGLDVDPDEYDAEEVRNETVATTADLDSYAATVNQSIRVEQVDPDADASNYTIAVNASARTNATREATRLGLETTIVTPTGSLPVAGQAVHVGDRAYLRDDDWVLQSRDAAWSPAAQDLALLRNASVSVDGAQYVGDERPALRLRVDPQNREAVERYGLDRSVSADPRPADTEVESTSVVAYVSPDAPHHLLGTDVEFHAAAAETDFVVTSTTRYADHEADVAVDVPEDLPTGNETTAGNDTTAGNETTAGNGTA